LPHGLFRSSSILDLDGSVSLDGGVGVGGTAREGDGEARWVAWWSVAQVVLEVDLVCQWSSSLSGGSAVIGEAPAQPRYASVLLHLLHPPAPPPHGPVTKT
jgi:hypothetical protein